jgi:hypothetical protein
MIVEISITKFEAIMYGQCFSNGEICYNIRRASFATVLMPGPVVMGIHKVYRVTSIIARCSARLTKHLITLSLIS